jgi:hypothetical protein
MGLCDGNVAERYMRAIPPFGATALRLRRLDNLAGADEHCMYTYE